MSIIRTDEQADALEILKLIIETTDFHRAMGELLTQENIDHKLFEIAKERETFIAPFQDVVKALDELPASPDSDKELVDELGGKLTQLLSADMENAILDKCLNKDELLAEAINNTALGEHSAEIKTLLNSLSDHLASAKTRMLNSK